MPAQWSENVTRLRLLDHGGLRAERWATSAHRSIVCMHALWWVYRVRSEAMLKYWGKETDGLLNTYFKRLTIFN